MALIDTIRKNAETAKWIGVVLIIAGVLSLWRQFPLSGVWAVGTLVGVHLLMSGWALVAIGGAVKSAARAVDEVGC